MGERWGFSLGKHQQGGLCVQAQECGSVSVCVCDLMVDKDAVSDMNNNQLQLGGVGSSSNLPLVEINRGGRGKRHLVVKV